MKVYRNVGESFQECRRKYFRNVGESFQECRRKFSGMSEKVFYKIESFKGISEKVFYKIEYFLKIESFSGIFGGIFTNGEGVQQHCRFLFPLQLG